MTVRCAKSLLVLLDEVNEVNPGRDKRSDGGLGDPAHAARISSHNPDVFGVYRARDFDADGIDAGKLAEHIRQLGLDGHPALGLGAYVIFNRRIASAARGWTWRVYTGVNPHTGHVHVSCTDDPEHYDTLTPWRWARPARPTGFRLRYKRPLERGDEGADVRWFKHALGLPTSGPDGSRYTDEMNRRVRRIQHRHGHPVTGRIGAWEAHLIYSRREDS